MTESGIDAARKICLWWFGTIDITEKGKSLMDEIASAITDALEAANRRIAELEGQIADLADERDDLEDTLNVVVECTSRDTAQEPNP